MIKQDPDKPWIDFVEGDLWLDLGTKQWWKRKDNKWLKAMGVDDAQNNTEDTQAMALARRHLGQEDR